MFLVDLLFPNRCLECNRIIHPNEVVCGLCFEHIYFTHDQFSHTNFLLEKCKLLFPIEQAAALLHFEEDSTSQKIIHGLKYRNREKLGKILAEWVLERINFQDLTPDLLVTVPLHPKKLKERGYNQLHLFADTLSKKLEIPCDHKVIKRNFYKKAQAKKSRDQRSSTEHLFSISKPISGKHILLIDDVFTTGNTMSAVAWEVLKNPGNKVSVLVMAVD